MADAVFVKQCENALAKLWNEASRPSEKTDQDDSPVLSEQCNLDIRESVNSVTKTYRYVLPTQLLAKFVDGKLDCRCLQAARGGPGAFDARTIAHEVIVPFDRAHQNVLGGSPEPYVNNPLRIPAVSAEFRDAQKNKSGWDALCRVLDEVELRNTPDFARTALVEVLRTIVARLEHARVAYPAPRRISVAGAITLIERFLAERSGGDRFESITAALFYVSGSRFQLFDSVRRASTNTADHSAGMLGDIECLDPNGNIVMVVEAKDRALTLRQIEDKIPGLRENRIAEAFFVAGKGIVPDDVGVVEEMIARQFVSGQNLYVVELVALARVLLSMLGESGRRDFLEQVGCQLDAYSDFQHRRAWADLLATV